MRSKTRRVITAVDAETGEVIECVELLKGDKIRTKEQQEYYQKREKQYKDKTPFVWAKFNYNKDFYSRIQPETLTRLMYFASFARKDNYVMQDIDIKIVLEINANQKGNFLKELVDKNIIIKDARRLLLNTEYFCKGEFEETDVAYTRVFTEAIQELYHSCQKTNEHRTLSYIFRMLPFVNRQTNILCSNQQEQDIKHIAYRTVTEFYSLIGMDITHTSRMKNKISNYRIDGELVVGFFDTLDELKHQGKYAVVNPKLFFGGDRTTENYKLICKLFEDEKLKHKE